MSNVIEVTNLSKQYRLGARTVRPTSLAGAIKQTLLAPFENYRKIRNLGNTSDSDDNVFWALNDVSFGVRQGDVVGVIGKNGAGKSTLLKILSRITEPTKGEAQIKGRVASLLEVGTGFHPELTGRENVMMNGTILGMTKREVSARFDEILDFSGVEKFIDTPVKFYSSGMKVRLGFAVAAHLEPEILIIDEVLAVGDAEFQKKCLGKMKDVSVGQGRTVLFVSHNLSSIQQLCNTGLVLQEGTARFFFFFYKACKIYREALDKEFEERSFFSRELESLQRGAIIEAELVNETGIRTTQFDFGESIILRVTYILNVDLKGAIVNFIISNSSQQILMSFDSDQDVEKLSFRKAGLYKTETIIPRERLKPGLYDISLGIGIANKEAIEQTDSALSFEVYSRKEGYLLASYYKDRIGVVPLIVEWNTKLIEN